MSVVSAKLGYTSLKHFNCIASSYTSYIAIYNLVFIYMQVDVLMLQKWLDTLKNVISRTSDIRTYITTGRFSLQLSYETELFIYRGESMIVF